MKNLKKVVAIFSVVGILGAVGVAYAAEQKTPAEIAEELTGKSISELYEERAEDKTFGEIADEAGKLDEFKELMLEQKKVILDQRVEDGILTQEEADEIYNQIEENQLTCDGTGSGQFGREYGIGFGGCQGLGQGLGQGFGRGMGRGNGMGNRWSNQ